MDTTGVLDDINKAALKLLSSYSLEKLCKVIVIEAVKLAGVAHGALYLEGVDKLNEVYVSTDASGLKIRKKSFLEKLLSIKKITILPDKQFKKMYPRLETLGIQSIIVIPLLHRNVSLGILLLYSLKSEHLTKKEIHVLNLFASMASLAITKMQLYEEAQRALEIRDRFISLASHELRTPLTSINGYIQLLHGKLAKKDTVESRWMEELYRENIRFTNLVKDLLDINRIKQGQLAFVLSEINIKQVIENALAQFQASHPERTISFFDNTSDSKYLVIGDSEKLIEMVFALVDNAIKFSGPETIITITLSRIERTIRIILRDQGKGIPQKDLVRIFEGFYKTKYSREKEGMGVGLLLAKHIVSLHRGKMEITSKEGKGTAVDIQLPAAEI